MASDMILKEETKVKNLIFGKRKINPIFKQEVEVGPETRRLYSVKRFRAHFWRKCSGPEVEDGMISLRRDKEIDLNEMKPVLRATRKYGKIVFDKEFCMKASRIVQSIRDLDSMKISVDYPERKGIQNLRGGFQRLISLRRLGIRFSGCPDLCDKQIQKISRGLKILDNLQDIGLSFSQVEITDQSLKKIGQEIGKLSNLQSFNLEIFAGLPKITEEGLYSFGLELAKLASLKSLSFSCSTRDQDLTEMRFLGLFKELRSLRNLELYFLYSNLTDEVLYNIGKGLRTLSSLENLKLKFYYCFKIDGRGMDAFGEGLEALVSLKNLYLSFQDCSEFSDSDLSGFSEGLQALTSLKTLTLNFENCVGFDNIGMEVLATGIGSLGSLETLILRLNSCGEYTDEGIKYIGESLKNLCFLKKFEFRAYGCYLTEIGMQYIIEGWRNLPLEEIKLEVANVFSTERIHSLGQCLNEIVTLKSVEFEIWINEIKNKDEKEAFFQAVGAYPWTKKAQVYMILS